MLRTSNRKLLKQFEKLTQMVVVDYLRDYSSVLEEQKRKIFSRTKEM